MRQLTIATLRAETAPDRAWHYRRTGLDALCEAIGVSIASLEMARLPDTLRGRMPQALRVVAYLEEVLNLLDDYQEHRKDIVAISQPPVAQRIADFREHIVGYMSLCDPERTDRSPEMLNQAYAEARVAYRALKTELLDAATARSIPVNHLALALEGIRSTLRVAEQLGKAVQRTVELSEPTGQRQVTAEAVDETTT